MVRTHEKPAKPAIWTVARYHRAIEAGIFTDWAVELLNGVIFEMSPEGPLHSGDIGSADRYLRKLIAENQAWFRLGNPVTLERSEPEPDIAIVKPSESGYKDRHPCLSDILLIIEFSDSSLERDTEGEKYQTYAMEGIPDYWVVNLRDKVLQVNRDPDQTEYKSRLICASGSIKPLLLDIQIDVERLLA
ncbi:MAG: Uma2 family endonuclease [Leptolyngbyaceae cyanobacterium MO_188.B28]|nr:Uma2 family endonuclease [Leptolyngbyaceae cyanobacterium MO_188.B28]